MTIDFSDALIDKHSRLASSEELVSDSTAIC